MRGMAAARAAGAARMSTGRELAWLVTAMPAHFDSAGADSTARLDTLAGIFESGAATLVRRLGPELRARDSALPDVDETAVDAQTDGGGLSIELLPAGPSTCLLLSVGEPGSQRHMLVDAGGSRPAERVRGRLRDLRVDEVDVLVLTHIDSDAVAGAVRILEDPDLMVDEVWFNDRSGAAWGAMS